MNGRSQGWPRDRRIPALSRVTAVAALMSINLALAAGDAVVEQRIERIISSLPPAVLVKGEAEPVSKLVDRMRSARVPGVSVAVINDGKIEWARGFGVTRIDGPAVTETTLFQAASISKPVSALGIMSLVQAGKLDLDADLNGYLKTWKVPQNEFNRGTKITLRQLLSHTAGMAVHGFPGYEAGALLPTLPQILDGLPPANSSAIRSDVAPGKTWRYSGGGYVIATLLVNDTTGQPFAEVMRKRVLTPLGMSDSTFDQPLSPGLLARAATPYRSDGTAVPGGPHVYPELAAAALWATPADLARFAIGMQQALSGKSKRVVTAATARAMLDPVLNQQAIGFVVGGAPQRRFFNHGGANEGYRCLLVAYENGDGAVIMTNSDSGEAVIRPLLGAIAREYEWPDHAPPVRTLSDVNPSTFDRVVGAYRLENGMTVTFWRDGERRLSSIVGQPPLELFPTSEHEYFLRTLDARWIFADGPEPAKVTLFQGGGELPAARLPGPEGRAALQFAMATQERVKKQTSAAGSEAALRELIAGLGSGKPNYDKMVPPLAELTRSYLAGLSAEISSLGGVQSVAFRNVSPAGEDTYEVRFEHGARVFHILLDADGKIYSAQFAR